MKNTKALFLLIFGTFLFSAGFAFADTAYEQLEKGFGDRVVEASPVNKDIYSPPVTPAPVTTTPPVVVAPKPPAPTPAPPKPTIGESISKFLGDNGKTILLGGIGAYLGFALFGPVGLILGALFFLGLNKM